MKKKEIKIIKSKKDIAKKIIHKIKKIKIIKSKNNSSRKFIHKRKHKKKKITKKSIIKINKVKSGNAKFDKLIGGGFESGSSNLIIGGNGSGKTIFAMQFLIEGIKNKENVLYITFEESKENFYRNMAEIGWDLNKMEKTGKFTFLEYSPEKIKIMLDEGGGSVESIIIKNKIKRMVIDAVSSFSMLFKEDSSKRQNINALFDLIKKWDCTTLLTFSDKDEEDAPIVEVQSDSLILLNFDKIKGKRQRTLEVIKMRGTDHSKDTYSFDIGRGGIKLKGKIKKNK